MLLTCGHSFHEKCLSRQSCIYCEPFLYETITDLSKKFNESIRATGSDDEDMIEDEEEEAAEDEEATSDDLEEYYTSEEFMLHLEAQLDGLTPRTTKPKFQSAKQKDHLISLDHDYM